MKIYRFLILLVATSGLVFFTGCGNQVQQKETDTPTSGKIKIAVDDAYRLLIDTEIYTFTSIYRNTAVDTICRNENEVFSLFMKDSVPLMVVNRQLTKDETDYLTSRQSIARTTRIAIDGIAFIVNKENPDSNLLFNDIRDIFKGRMKQWKQINPKSGLGGIKVIFDHVKSGNPRYFKDKFGLDSLPGICFAVANNAEVISFVEKNKEAIGLISVNWISDREDTISQRFLKNVRVAGISPEGSTDHAGNFYQPFQYYIAQGFYPFTREVYFINRQSYSGLAFGFTSFVAGNQGQLIVLRSGLVPAVMPVRIVEIKR